MGQDLIHLGLGYQKRVPTVLISDHLEILNSCRAPKKKKKKKKSNLTVDLLKFAPNKKLLSGIIMLKVTFDITWI